MSYPYEEEKNMNPNQTSLYETFHQSPLGDFKANFYNPYEVKTRKRTTRKQFKILEEAFKKNPKPSAEARKEIALKLEMSPRGVQVWFQNRRAKAKNQKHQESVKKKDVDEDKLGDVKEKDHSEEEGQKDVQQSKAKSKSVEPGNRYEQSSCLMMNSKESTYLTANQLNLLNYQNNLQASRLNSSLSDSHSVSGLDETLSIDSDASLANIPLMRRHSFGNFSQLYHNFDENNSSMMKFHQKPMKNPMSYYPTEEINYNLPLNQMNYMNSVNLPRNELGRNRALSAPTIPPNITDYHTFGTADDEGSSLIGDFPDYFPTHLSPQHSNYPPSYHQEAFLSDSPTLSVQEERIQTPILEYADQLDSFNPNRRNSCPPELMNYYSDNFQTSIPSNQFPQHPNHSSFNNLNEQDEKNTLETIREDHDYSNLLDDSSRHLLSLPPSQHQPRYRHPAPSGSSKPKAATFHPFSNPYSDTSNQPALQKYYESLVNEEMKSSFRRHSFQSNQFVHPSSNPSLFSSTDFNDPSHYLNDPNSSNSNLQFDQDLNEFNNPSNYF